MNNRELAAEIAKELLIEWSIGRVGHHMGGLIDDFDDAEIEDVEEVIFRALNRNLPD